MEFFNDAMISGLCKQRAIVAFISVLNKKLKKNNIVSYIGIKNTPSTLLLIANYIPELYNINEISPGNWGYYLHPPLFENAFFDVLNSKQIDFTSYFYDTDILSIPIVFNGISNQTGIYKLSCICDKNIYFTIGITNRETFNEKIYNRTYNKCFWPNDIFHSQDSDLISLTREDHFGFQGKIHIFTKDYRTSESIKFNNVDETNFTIIWDSYQHILYFYEEDRLVSDFGFEGADIEFVPFIYLYYDSFYEKSDCLVNIENKKILFK